MSQDFGQEFQGRPGVSPSVVLSIVLSVLLVAALGTAGYFGVGYTRELQKNAQAGAQAFNYLVSPVRLPNGQDVALGDILAQMAKAAASQAQVKPADAPKAGK